MNFLYDFCTIFSKNSKYKAFLTMIKGLLIRRSWVRPPSRSPLKNPYLLGFLLVFPSVNHIGNRRKNGQIWSGYIKICTIFVLKSPFVIGNKKKGCAHET